MTKELKNKIVGLYKSFIQEYEGKPTRLFISHLDTIDATDIEGRKPNTIYGLPVTYYTDETRYE